MEVRVGKADGDGAPAPSAAPARRPLVKLADAAIGALVTAYAFLDDLTPSAPVRDRRRAAATIARWSDLGTTPDET